MPYFQIEIKHSPTDKTYLYFEAGESEQERACELVEEKGITMHRIMVREYNPTARKRVRKGREFTLKLRRVVATLSTGRIISESWYEPGRWD